MVTPERGEKATERKESSWGKERVHGPTHPTEDCEEEQGAEFNTSWGTELGNNEKISWMQSTTAVWAGCWQGLSMAAFALCCFFPFWMPRIGLLPVQSTKCIYTKIYTRSLFSSVSSRLAMDLCCYPYLRRPGNSSWQLLISAVRNWQKRGKCTLQRQPGTFNLHQLEKWLLNTRNCSIHRAGLRQLLSNWARALCPSSRVCCTRRSSVCLQQIKQPKVRVCSRCCCWSTGSALAPAAVPVSPPWGRQPQPQRFHSSNAFPFPAGCLPCGDA